MKSDKLIQTLHPLERSVLPKLEDNATLDELVNKTKLKSGEVMRALQWLENKGILKIKTEIKEIVKLDSNGEKYLKEGLPERKFLQEIKSKPKKLDQIKLSKEEKNISLGLLRKKSAINIRKGMEIKITGYGEKLLEKESLEEKFLKSLPKQVKELSPEERFAYQELKKRKKIIKSEIKKEKTVHLTQTGKWLTKQKLQTNLIDTLTPNLIKTGQWKNKKFRRYDVKINVPKIYGGRRHFVNLAINYAKRVWMDLGFKEMKGPILNTSFWNFDALFTAQDHPVRELQDTFYIKNPAKGKIINRSLMEKVKKTHENGWTTGSKGWQYNWDKEDAKRNVLRTHTTVLSAQTLAKLKKSDWPAKYFAIGKCFRNETVDWCHLFEFNQTEGIVVDPNANFRHLLGYLKEFFKKMGYPKARFRPAYFPYTEQSIEIDIFHPHHKKWVELGGAGMFRPEVVKPLLGEEVPVLAWGPGFDRIITEYYNIKDIRDLYKNDLKKLKEIKHWMR